MSETEWTPWDWIARPKDYEPRVLRQETTLHGVAFPFTHVENGPPGWPCQNEKGMTANPGSTWWICNGCGNEVARVQRGGCGGSIDAQETNKRVAFEFHVRNCPKLERR